MEKKVNQWAKAPAGKKPATPQGARVAKKQPPKRPEPLYPLMGKQRVVFRDYARNLSEYLANIYGPEMSINRFDKTLAELRGRSDLRDKLFLEEKAITGLKEYHEKKRLMIEEQNMFRQSFSLNPTTTNVAVSSVDEVFGVQGKIPSQQTKRGVSSSISPIQGNITSVDLQPPGQYTTFVPNSVVEVFSNSSSSNAPPQNNNVVMRWSDYPSDNPVVENNQQSAFQGMEPVGNGNQLVVEDPMQRRGSMANNHPSYASIASTPPDTTGQRSQFPSSQTRGTSNYTFSTNSFGINTNPQYTSQEAGASSNTRSSSLKKKAAGK